MKMMFRDDDISKFTDYYAFNKVNELFTKYRVLHTVAVEMEGIWENKIIFYMLCTDPFIDVELHGWTHRDYGKLSFKECDEDITRALDYWYSNKKRGQSGVPEASLNIKNITRFLPPWNSVGEGLKEACKKHNLIIDTRGLPEVYQFHWWSTQAPRRLGNLEGYLSKETGGR